MDYFYPQPEQALVEDRADTPTEQASQAAATQHSRTGGLVDPAMRAQEVADLKVALASPDRLRIDAPRVAGSINLRGGVIDDVRGLGLMIAVELGGPCTGLVAEGLDAGVLINVTKDNTVRLLPPLTLTDQQADELVALVSGVIGGFAGNPVEA